MIEERRESATHSINFVYRGQAPSKSNFRRGGKDWRKKWSRLKQFEEEIGWLARAEISKLDECPTVWLYDYPEPTVTVYAYAQRADADNIAKSLLDGLEGVCYLNDKYVAVKVFPKKGGPGRLEVKVEWSGRESR